ncbi:LapA family protein [Polycladidibacter hongkongensis]|uniref:LapA family protein n=1 Tax=Polycladidibacter hongkongensis TaxID=1647556 RepID=UPI00082EDDDA|nr:LapA family protein [Pseudovibrio hongkongensis]
MTRLLKRLLLLPIGLLVIVLAVANRHSVSLALNPFDPADTMLTLSIPLFWLLFGAAALGVILGGVATWNNQGKFRKEARVNRREVNKLRAESDQLKTLGEGSTQTAISHHA